jgi:type IV secretory pathway component VirB8
MARPEYVEDGTPSIETWQEACVISQEWADDARLAASKRRNRMAWLSIVLMLIIAAVLIMLTLIVTETWTP